MRKASSGTGGSSSWKTLRSLIRATGQGVGPYPELFLRQICGDVARRGGVDGGASFLPPARKGAPKGVCLSHENLITNVHQALSRIGISGEDHFFNALPLFHAFGLTVGTIIPVMIGARAFFYANPLHYRMVPEMAYEKECTVLCGTPTFLRGYGRRANPYDFSFMRHVFSGGGAPERRVVRRLREKVRDTRAGRLRGHGVLPHDQHQQPSRS